MSAVRYSGGVRIRVTWVDVAGLRDGGHYRCCLSRGDSGGWTVRTTQYVGSNLQHGSGIGIDSPEAFDSAASAALSFASNSETAEDDNPSAWWNTAAHDAGLTGWHVGRSPKQAWPPYRVPCQTIRCLGEVFPGNACSKCKAWMAPR